MMSANKSSVSTKRILSFIWENYKAYPIRWIFAILFRTLTIALSTVPALYYKDIINLLSKTQVATSEIAQHGISILFIILWIKLVQFIFYRVYDYIIITFEMNIQEKLYNQIFSYLHQHSFQFFANNFSGSLISKVRKCVSGLERFTDMLSWNVLPFILNLILVVGIIAVQNIRIAISIFIWVTVFSIIQYQLHNWIHPYQEKANQLDSELGGLLSDTITNNLTIKLFASLPREQKAFSSLNHDTVQARKLQYYKSMRIWGFSAFFGLVLEITIMYAAIRLWWIWTFEIGVIVLIQTYVLKIIEELRGIGMTFRSFFRNISEIWEIVEILDTPHEVIDNSDQKLKVKDGEIRFEKVDFSYGENQIFNALDLTIKPGERVALVGESGSWKTTITKLLFRFYDLQGGEILIDNQNIANVTQNSLRENISMIPQEPVLFHRSIRDNIAYGKPNATEQEIIAASKMARCHEFIWALKDGYDTLVWERGIKLSWGERQRVAIARAILENRQIIVMDEATSALDSESEFLIQEAINELMQNKTVLIIAHRLSTIMKMDKIIVMHQWKIIEKGSHQELLLNKDGTYRKLRDIQSGGFIWKC